MLSSPPRVLLSFPLATPLGRGGNCEQMVRLGCQVCITPYTVWGTGLFGPCRTPPIPCPRAPPAQCAPWFRPHAREAGGEGLGKKNQEEPAARPAARGAPPLLRLLALGSHPNRLLAPLRSVRLRSYRPPPLRPCVASVNHSPAGCPPSLPLSQPAGRLPLFPNL